MLLHLPLIHSLTQMILLLLLQEQVMSGIKELREKLEAKAKKVKQVVKAKKER